MVLMGLGLHLKMASKLDSTTVAVQIKKIKSSVNMNMVLDRKDLNCDRYMAIILCRFKRFRKIKQNM